MESAAGSILRPLEDAATSLEARLANGERVSDHGALRTIIRRLEGLSRRARGAACQRRDLFDPNVLPRDVRNHIIAFAPFEAVLRMESCCKNSRHMMHLDDEPTWRLLFGLYFGPAPANITQHWRKAFRRTSLLRIEPGVRTLGVRFGRQMTEVVVRESQGKSIFAESGIIQVDERTAAAPMHESSLEPLSASFAERAAEFSTVVQLRYLNLRDIEGDDGGDDKDQEIVLNQSDYVYEHHGPDVELICAGFSYTSESVLFDPTRPRLSRQGFRPGSPFRDLLNGYGLPLNLRSVDILGGDHIGPTFRLVDLNTAGRELIPHLMFSMDLREDFDLQDTFYLCVDRQEEWENLEPSLQGALLDARITSVKNTQAEPDDSEEEASEEDTGWDGDGDEYADDGGSHGDGA